jgi:hypothetical protein
VIFQLRLCRLWSPKWIFPYGCVYIHSPGKMEFSHSSYQKVPLSYTHPLAFPCFVIFLIAAYMYQYPSTPANTHSRAFHFRHTCFTVSRRWFRYYCHLREQEREKKRVKSVWKRGIWSDRERERERGGARAGARARPRARARARQRERERERTP